MSDIFIWVEVYGDTGAGSYGMQIAIPRNVTTPYLAIRYNENNSLAAWQKISAGYTITWTTIAVTWKTNNGGAPTLNNTGYTVIVLWKVGTTVYGARVGDA